MPSVISRDYVAWLAERRSDAATVTLQLIRPSQRERCANDGARSDPNSGIGDPAVSIRRGAAGCERGLLRLLSARGLSIDALLTALADDACRPWQSLHVSQQPSPAASAENKLGPERVLLVANSSTTAR